MPTESADHAAAQDPTE